MPKDARGQKPAPIGSIVLGDTENHPRAHWGDAFQDIDFLEDDIRGLLHNTLGGRPGTGTLELRLKHDKAPYEVKDQQTVRFEIPAGTDWQDFRPLYFQAIRNAISDYQDRHGIVPAPGKKRRSDVVVLGGLLTMTTALGAPAPEPEEEFPEEEFPEEEKPRVRRKRKSAAAVRRSRAARKGWATRRAQARKRSLAARKGWVTRRRNAAKRKRRKR